MTGSRDLCWMNAGAGAVVAIAAALAPVAAQDLFEIVDVPLVEVEVLVTNTQGQPIHDLPRDAFRLLIDGEEQEVVFFSAPAVNQPTEGTEPPVRDTHLVILFDNNSVENQTRNAVIEDYRSLLSETPRSRSEILIATTSGAGLEIQQDFTTDIDLIDASLRKVATMVARDRHVTEYESLLMDIQRLAGSRDPTKRGSTSQAATLVSRIIAFSERARQDGLQTAGYIWQLAEALVGLPGQKSILYIGGAVSVSPGEALLAALKGVLDRSGDEWARKAGAELPAGVASGGSSEIDALSAAASVRGVSVYSLIVGGSNQGLASGTSAGSLTAKDSSTMDGSGSWSPGFDSSTRTESRSALDSLAAATGGFVHAKTGGAQTVLARIHDQLSSRYVLGFHPTVGADGRPHAIGIQLAGHETRLVVRHRKSFQAQSWDQETAAQLRSALLFGRDRNPLQLSLEAGVAAGSSEKTRRVPLTLRLPLSRLALEPVRDTHRGQASVFVVGEGDSRLNAGPVRKSVLPVVLPNDDLQGAMGQMAEYRLDVEVSKRARSLAVGVRDDLSTELSIVQLPVPIEQLQRVEPRIKPAPELPPTPAGSVSVRLPSAALLMSGQQGGSLLLEVDPAMVLDISPPSEDSSRQSMDLEVHIYVLDSEGDPLARSSHREWIDLTPEGIVLTVPVEIPDGSAILSVLARDVSTNDFGLTRLAIDATTPIDVGESANLQLRIRAGTQIAAEVVEAGRSRPAAENPTSAGRVSRQEVSRGLIEVLELAAGGRRSAARERLRDLEIGATRGLAPKAIVDLGKREAKAVMAIADGSWERLLPLALLWGELIDEYRRQRLGPLSEHAITMSTQLAARMARQASSEESKAEAANLLVSLSGYLLYAQRLSKTEELLELATKVEDENETALLALTATREQLGDFDGALEVLTRLLEGAPDNPEGRLRMGVNLTRAGQTAAAEPILRSVAEQQDPEWIGQVATQELARLLAARGQLAEAIGVVEHATERWPGEPAMEVQLAWLLDLSREPDRASDLATRLAQGSRSDEVSPRFRYHRWYLEGLKAVRLDLSGRSSSRAKEAVEGLPDDAASKGGP